VVCFGIITPALIWPLFPDACSAERCVADPGSSHTRHRSFEGHGSTAHHCVLHRGPVYVLKSHAMFGL
jgi:hypothetical protein